MISHQELLEVMDYDPITGIFIWKKCRKPQLNGKPVGYSCRKGYLLTEVANQKYFLHKLAWYYVTGSYPTGIIDHIDTDKTNNKINNLREATINQNVWNMSISRRNTSGVKGISYDPQRKKWRATLMVDRKEVLHKRFDLLSDAEDAIREAREKFHGEYARHK